MIARTLIVAIILLLFSCNNEQSLSGEDLLNRAIEVSGGDSFFHSTISFDAQGMRYTMERDGNIANFTSERQVDTTYYKATYRNGYQQYFVNGVEQEESFSSRKFISSRLEGFLYLTSIPHVFNQTAVIVNRKEDVVIRNKTYQVLHITFTKLPEDDPGNEFYLYIDPVSGYVEFRAEKLDLDGETNLLKKAYNPRIIEGIRFVDYKVFTTRDTTMLLSDYYKAYDIPNLIPIGDIEYTNIEVELKE